MKTMMDTMPAVHVDNARVPGGGKRPTMLPNHHSLTTHSYPMHGLTTWHMTTLPMKQIMALLLSTSDDPGHDGSPPPPQLNRAQAMHETRDPWIFRMCKTIGHRGVKKIPFGGPRGS
jgi:hypothetical protein